VDIVEGQRLIDELSRAFSGSFPAGWQTATVRATFLSDTFLRLAGSYLDTDGHQYEWNDLPFDAASMLRELRNGMIGNGNPDDKWRVAIFELVHDPGSVQVDFEY